MATITALAKRRGYTIRRGRSDPNRLWLVTGDGRLLSDPAGSDEARLRALLADATAQGPTPA